MFDRNDFTIEKRAGGWAVMRSDGAMMAQGFRTKAEAEAWWNREAKAVGL